MSRVLSNSARANLAKRLALSPLKPQLRTKAFSTVVKPLAVNALTSVRSFHNTCVRLNESAEAALKEVIKSEKDVVSAIPNELESSYQDFLSQSGFKIIASPGKANVEMVKTDESTGNIIHVYFDIDEITDIPTEDFEAMEGDLEEEADSLDQLLCNVKVLVEKPDNTGLFFSLLLQNTESSIMIDFINVQKDVKQFIKNVQEQNEFVDKFNYQGPKFAELDESLQTEFENYLLEKGVNNDLADFIVAYSDVKEEDEYRLWINEIGKFLN
ncbi:Mitochondrial acidic protein mam33 [Lodderomyces elongisporus]|uniref:Mitochondrial acidic protein MAM33 n=1 Tax=Lodderomyces elongisporus (strain ATCC 11503 / CBS 2605 / JCM 1781 / NBRC 1676 / NRRL YB-4239) TaxID=379508 RepID=A5E627_LODEL|nr:Mitochondrial acidic protein mam33 [Lodderomyces elongisporus]EDK46885.1 conserved hypothetical protein [Lodderomyces elongisporus NRRL YB-4239]WLF81408.1 Mitochondrial acidic protein mam33 [Lodderomyces elongisporus]